MQPARESATKLPGNGAAQLVSKARVSFSRGSHVPCEEALQALRETRNWSPPPNAQDSCFHLLITEAGREQPFSWHRPNKRLQPTGTAWLSRSVVVSGR